MTAFLYKMTCLTNLHVGNGDVNYSIIDNEVELDYVLKEPTIPSSGVKGALLSYVETIKADKGLIKMVFGATEESVGTSGSKEKNTSKGNYKFLAANLLSRPVRVSEGKYSFANATSYELIDRYNSLCENLGIEVNKLEVAVKGCIGTEGISEVEGIKVEQHPAPESLSAIIPEPMVIMPNFQLNEIPLPVVARNKLGDDGNLWYEQFVPYNSIFYMIIITPDKDNKLDKLINNKIVQFGGNASIGYGLMKIEKIAHSINE